MIAVDAMGGDYAPRSIVEGALRVAQQGIPILLFGDQRRILYILKELDSQWPSYPLEIVHCSQTIGMEEEPSKSVLKKTDSSIVKAMYAVAQGKATSIVSAGNSGVVLVASTLILGRFDGIARPAIGGFLPTINGNSVFCLDLGANADSKPEYLEQFAYMGHAYVRVTKKIDSPRIALLSNGSEPYKGSIIVKQAYEYLMRSPLQFVGNVESRDLFDDRTDVLVCDGFSGNILLKAVQGTVKAISSWIDRECRQSLWRSLLFSVIGRVIWKKIKAKTDYAKTGGALLLGVKFPVIVAHGCSNAQAIENAIKYAHHISQSNIIPLFAHELKKIMIPRSLLYNKVRKLGVLQNL